MGARSTIFLSYRHGDQQAVGRLTDHLEKHYKPGEVFIDTRIHPGTRWADAIKDAVGQGRILLAVIGHNWHLHADDLKKPDDWVRREIQTALDSDVLAVPVLVDGARLPFSHTLPTELTKLVDVQAAELSDAYYSSDVRKLLDYLDAVLFLNRRRLTAGAWAIATVLLVGALLGLPVTAIPDPLPGLPTLWSSGPVLIEILLGVAALSAAAVAVVNARRWLVYRRRLGLGRSFPANPRKIVTAALLLVGLAAVWLVIVRGSNSTAVVKDGETWNVRDRPSNSSRVVDEAKGGQELVIACVDAKGWARLTDPWPGHFVHSNGLNMDGDVAPCS